jgi:predicted acylesterase/phospholipase RssA/CRP-like cAMP-binding protein
MAAIGGSKPSERERNNLRELLKQERLFSSLNEETLAELVDACEVVSAPGGTYLLRAGEPIEALYGVVYGTMRVVATNQAGEETVRELYRGEMLGVLGMFIDRPLPVDLLLVRDSVLFRLERSRFLELAQRHPALLQGSLKLMSEHMVDLLETVTGGERPGTRRGGNITFVVGTLDDAAAGFTRELIELLLAERSTVQVTAEIVDGTLGAGMADGDGPRLTEWLSNLERDHQRILYVADAERPEWTARCIRQSDRLVVVSNWGEEANVEALAAALLAKEGDVRRRVDLVSVHPRATELPSGSRMWTQTVRVSRVHHVRRGLRGDTERVARHLLGRSIAVVLSGGGARGLAHLGVLAALVEAKIPIDYICGTSMGSIFAAGFAQGWSIERMRAMVREVFTPLFALYDLTLPVSSLLAGKKLDGVMQKLYDDAQIEDLWLPFFCVSTDLSRAKLVVHDQGSLWKSVRASCTIPGIFPPLAMHGCALVDGGLMDNLPIDLMADRCDGPIIAVDVFPYGDPTFTHPVGVIAPRLRKLRTRIKGEPASPPLFDILMRSTLVGSKFRQETAAARLGHVVYLTPPVAPFGILHWRAHEALFETGYRYARDELAGPWQERLALAG